MQRLVDLLVRGFGLILVFAGITKLRDPYAFLKTVYDYELLPLYGGILTASFVPWLEIFCGIFLVAGIWRKACLLIATTLLLGFITAQGFAIYNGLEIACGCFGTQASVGAKSISISSALAISCVIALVWNGRSVKQISGRSFY